MRSNVFRQALCLIFLLSLCLIPSRVPDGRAQSSASKVSSKPPLARRSGKKKTPRKLTKKELKTNRHLAMAQYFRVHEKNAQLALKEYQAALRLNPKNLKAAFGALDELARMKNFKGARKLLKRLRKTHPQNDRFDVIAARLLIVSGHIGGGLKAYRRWVTKNPHGVPVRLELIKLLIGQHRQGNASVKKELIEHCRFYLKLIKSRRSRDANLIRRLLANFEGGPKALRVIDAVASYEAAFSARRSPKINRHMSEARKGFEACLKDQPAHAKCQFFLGLVHSSVKASSSYDAGKAHRMFEAIKEGKFYPESRIEMARFYRQADQLHKAEEALSAARSFNPKHQRVLLESGIVAKLDGRDDDAELFLSKTYDANRDSHLAQKALNELAQINPEHALVQHVWARGGIRSSEGNVFSTERYKSAMTSLEKRFGGVVVDAPENAILEQVLQRLLKGGEIDPTQTFKIQLLKTKVVNAFATPNGHIYFTRGFFDFLKKSWPDRPIDANHDVLAQVMAHEVVHVIRRHTVRSQMFRQAAKDASQRLSRVVLTHVTRIHEIEADREGMVLAFLAGYHPRGSIEMMEKRGMEREIPTHLDHPTYDERVEHLEEFWSNEVKYAWMSFEFAKEKLEEARRIEDGASGDLRKQYQGALDHLKRFETILRPVRESMNNLGITYLKLGLLKLGSQDSPLKRWQSPLSIEETLALQFVAVRKKIRESASKRTRSRSDRSPSYAPKPRPIPYEIKQAIRVLKKAVRRYPNYTKARLNLAAAYLSAREKKRAATTLAEVEKQIKRRGKLLLTSDHITSSEGEGVGEFLLLGGIVAAEDRNYGDAGRLFGQAIKHPSSARAASYNKGYLLELKGRKLAAKKAFEGYLTKYPTGTWSQRVKRRLSRL
jgi:predicted Zn-dependent protease